MYELLDGAVTVASYFPLVLFLQPYLFLLFLCFYSIAQLNSDIRKTEFALSNIDSKYKFVGNCYKQNKRVYINGYFHCTSPNVGTTTCFFVPEGFRPKIKCGSACYTDDDVNFNNIGAVKVDTNGDITIYFPTVYSNCVYVSMVYDIN